MAISLVDLGRALQRVGFQISEHPAFGGVAPVHVKNSHHYAGNALDINWPGGGATEKRMLDQLYNALRGSGYRELIWQAPGHYTHLHLAATQPLRVTPGLAALANLQPSGGGFSFSPALVSIPSFPVPGVPGGAFPTLTVPSYPREPLPIPAAQLATWDERLAAANRALREAKAAEKLGKAQVEGEYKRFLDAFRREVGVRREGIMDEAADRNLALQPIFVNPRMRELSARAAETEAEATAQRTDRLNALRQMVKNAERAKTDVEELNRRDKARVRSELDRLIGI